MIIELEIKQTYAGEPPERRIGILVLGRSSNDGSIEAFQTSMFGNNPNEALSKASKYIIDKSINHFK